MPTDATVTVKGAKELRRALRKAGDDLDDMKTIHADAARVVRSEAERRAPRRTGRLARDLRSSGTKTKAKVAVGRKSVPYAHPIHFGWPRRNIAPQPFLLDALGAKGRHVVALYWQRVRQITGVVNRTRG